MSRIFNTFAVLALSLTLGGSALAEVTDQKTASESPWETVQEISTIFLEQPVHMSTRDGKDVLVESGRYQVNAEGKDTLRLVADGGKQEILVQGFEISPPSKVESPAAAAIPNEENSDLVHVIFAQPNGKAIEAIGSKSGVQGRAPGQSISSSLKADTCWVKNMFQKEPLSPFIYGVNGEGHVMWYRHNGGWYGSGLELARSWDGPRYLGRDIRDVRFVAQGLLGEFYVIHNTGQMFWYQQTYQGPPVGVRREPDTIVGANKQPIVWNGVKEMFSAGEGVIYAIKNDEKLLWRKHKDWKGGNGDWSNWQGDPQYVGSGWQDFKHVFSPGYGVIYAVTHQGAVKWYKHNGYRDGTPNWIGPIDVNNGWTNYIRMFSPGKGIIYGVTPNGDLVWYRHHTWAQQAPGGVGRCDWSGPRTVGKGWTFPFVFGLLPY